MASASRGGVVTPGIGERVAAIDWEGVGADLDAVGHARIRDLLTEGECRSLAADFDDDERKKSKKTNFSSNDRSGRDDQNAY